MNKDEENCNANFLLYGSQHWWRLCKLKRTDIESENIKLVARALLPEGINEGTNLKYEMLQYEIIE